MTYKKKLIEVSLPLETINRESAREKNIHAGHPSTLHLYWARRPLATSRAILFAQLVDDPSAHPEKYPTPQDQEKERLRLHGIIERLVNWDNLNDDNLFSQAEDEIRESNGGELPVTLDPFAGGGSIPIEAQRLGLESHASDLNPLAVLLNRALIDYPSRFSGMKPVNPHLNEVASFSGHKSEGLATDIRHYAQLLKARTESSLGHLYPKVPLNDGTEASVIAWIWARTVISPNPANPIRVPLVHSWWLSKRKGKEAYVRPLVLDGEIRYEVVHDSNGPSADEDGTIGRRGGFAVGDGTPISLDYVRKEGRAGRLGATLLAIVAEGPRGRMYLSPNKQHQDLGSIDRPINLPEGTLPVNPRDFKTPNYGMSEWKDLFTPRQLTTLDHLYSGLDAIRETIVDDALSAGFEYGEPLEAGGTGALAYAESVMVYLALAIGRTADYGNALCGWRSDIETLRNLFSKQSISMVWDYAESNPFSSSTGNFLGQAEWVAKAVANAPSKKRGQANQANASTRNYQGYVISTDPPYYDNIGYSDLSDFFYVWLRRALVGIMPELMGTILTPKSEELVADPYRHGGKAAAEEFFVEGFNQVFSRIAKQSNLHVPITVYYAYKQQEEDASGKSSTGWHTLLSGLIASGWEITATWPVRTESTNRLIGNGRNVLASSIVLSCRLRSETAEATTRRAFINALKTELPHALRELMQGTIAPVDLAQAAIGPGISVFSRYSRVRDADGSDMSVKEALLLINQTLDEVLNEQESDFDPNTRFAVKWYKEYGWAEGQAGIADQLSRSSDTSIQSLERGGIFEAKAGKARLLSPLTILNPDTWDPAADESISIWECVVRLAGIMDKKGLESVANLIPAVEKRVGLDPVKELGFLLFYEAEKKGDTKDAILFNGLVSSWGDLTAQARRVGDRADSAAQFLFELEGQEYGDQ